MSGPFDSDPVKRAVGRQASAAQRVAEFTASMAALDASRPNLEDFDSALAHRERVAALGAKIELAKEALAGAETALAAAVAAASDQERQKAHNALEAEAKATERRVHSIIRLQRRLAEELALLAEHRSRVGMANTERGNRPWIADGEVRVRGVPARTTPAHFEDQEQWVDGAGRRPAEYRREKDSGDFVPVEAGYVKKTVRVQIAAERFEPASSPESLTTSVRLVGLDGRQLWPEPGR